MAALKTIEVVKPMSLGSVVSFAELLYAAEMTRTVTYNTSPLFRAAAFFLYYAGPLFVRQAGSNTNPEPD